LPNGLVNVASDLAGSAFATGDINDKDAYARSALNRYYYATFLEARRLLSGIDSKWSSTPHKSYPDHLKGKMLKRIKKKSQKMKDLNDFSSSRLLDSAGHNLPLLAAIMEEGYKLRIQADYFPENKVEFKSATDYVLNNTTLENAKTWPSRAEKITNQILRAWNMG